MTDLSRLKSLLSLFSDSHIVSCSSEQFLKETNDASESPIEARWGEKQKHDRQVLTDQNRMDGFYYVVLENKMYLMFVKFA